MITYLCDTGPLLCFAQFPEGPKLFLDRYVGRVQMATDVDVDLVGLKKSDLAKVARAAMRANGKAFSWIPRIAVDSEELLEEVLLVRELIDTFRIKPKGARRKPREDLADAVSIVWAKHHPTTIRMTNDSPARRAARSIDVASISVVDILEAMVREQTITDAQRNKWLLGMKPELDAGAFA